MGTQVSCEEAAAANVRRCIYAKSTEAEVAYDEFLPGVACDLESSVGGAAATVSYFAEEVLADSLGRVGGKAPESEGRTGDDGQTKLGGEAPSSASTACSSTETASHIGIGSVDIAAGTSVPNSTSGSTSAARDKLEKDIEIEVFADFGIRKLGWSRRHEPPLLLTAVTAGSWAESVGLREGDELVTIGGRNAAQIPRAEADEIVTLVRPLALTFVRRQSGVRALRSRSLRKAKEIEAEVHRLKSETCTERKQVMWKDGKLVTVYDSDSESDDEDVLGLRSPLDREIHAERNRVGIKKAVKQDCNMM